MRAADNRLVLTVLSGLVALGNTAFPIILRLMIWLCRRFRYLRKKGRREEREGRRRNDSLFFYNSKNYAPYKLLLVRPRSLFTHLFPATETKYAIARIFRLLFVSFSIHAVHSFRLHLFRTILSCFFDRLLCLVWILMTVAQFVVFVALNWNSRVRTQSHFYLWSCCWICWFLCIDVYIYILCYLGCCWFEHWWNVIKWLVCFGCNTSWWIQYFRSKYVITIIILILIIIIQTIIRMII